MKRIALMAALLATPLLAQAQWAYEDPEDFRNYDEEVAQLGDELERLQSDPRIARFAGDELARAEDYIDELSIDAAGDVTPGELRTAEGMLARAERAGLARYADEQEGGPDVVIVDDDEEAWVEAEDAREDARRARDAADDASEAAVAARLEAENERAANARLRQELGARETERGLVVTLGDVLFASGKSELRPGAARTLDNLVTAMKRDRDTTVTIEGHTDSTGKHALNVALSQKRANAVRGYLTSRGVASARVKARGLGPDYPVATNRTEAGRQQNRRVELVVQNDVAD